MRMNRVAAPILAIILGLGLGYSLDDAGAWGCGPGVKCPTTTVVTTTTPPSTTVPTTTEPPTTTTPPTTEPPSTTTTTVPEPELAPPTSIVQAPRQPRFTG